VYAFSGWMIGYWEESLILEHSFLWLPLALYGSNLIFLKKPTLGFLLLVVALSSSVFSGFFQMAIYVYVAVILWNIFKIFENKSDKKVFFYGILIILGIITPLLISAVQLMPTIESFYTSPRGTMDAIFLFRDHLVPLEHLLTFIAPDFWGNPGTYNYFGGKAFYFEKTLFIGILPLIFAIYAFLFVRSKRLIFWKWFALMTCILGFATPLGWFPYILHIPVLSSSYPTRIFALTLFSLVTILSYGIDDYMEKPKWREISRCLLFISLVLSGMWIFVLYVWMIFNNYLFVAKICSNPLVNSLCSMYQIGNTNTVNHLFGSVSLRNIVIPTFFLLASWITIWVLKYSKKIFIVCIFSLAFVSSFYFSSKYTYFSERRFVYPDTSVIKKLKELAGYNRVWGYGNAFIEKNIAQYFQLYSTDGYGFLSPKWYGELLATIQSDGKLTESLRRSDTDLFEASEKEALGKGNPYRLRLMSLLGVKYILETKKGPDKEHKLIEERFPESIFTLAYEDETWRIWEYKNALPRAFLATQVKVIDNKQKMIDFLYDPNIDLKKTVIVQTGSEFIKAMNEENAGKGEDLKEVKIIRYEPNTVLLSVESERKGMVFLSDTYYPGWKATVDGKQTEILQVDYAFRGIPVEKGNHSIEMSYKPISVVLGLVVTFFGISILLIVVYILVRTKNFK
jgi:hypothetical protein